MTRNTLGDKFVKGLAAPVFEVVDQADKDYSLVNTSAFAVEGNNSTALFKSRYSSNKAQETMAGLTQLGDLEETQETEGYKNDNFSSGYEVQFRFYKYTKRITISEENVADAEVEAKLQDTGRLYTAGKRTANKHMFQVINKGFTAQSSITEKYIAQYADGKPLLSTIHPLKVSGGTNSNASSTGIALTEDNLETARIALMEQKGDRGELLSYGNGSLILLVPHTLEKKGQIIAKGEKRSGTANNDLNVYDGLVTVMSAKWLSAANGGSDTAWYLVDAMESPLVAFFRQQLQVEAPWMEKFNKNINIDISGRWSMGVRTWRGLWGSKGDGAAYSS